MGEVPKPGRYELRSWTTVLDVIAMAGGLSQFAARAGSWSCARTARARSACPSTTTRRCPPAASRRTSTSRPATSSWCRSEATRTRSGHERRGAARAAGSGELRAVWRRRRWLALPVFVFPLAAAVSLVAFHAERLRVDGARPGRPPAGARGVRAVHGHERARDATPHDQPGDPEPLPAGAPDHPVRALPELRERVPAEEVIERMRKDIQPRAHGAAESARAGVHHRLHASATGAATRRRSPRSPTPSPPSTSRKT